VKRTALEPDRDGELRLWADSAASARRFGISIAIVFLAVPLGVAMGTFPYVDALFYRFLSLRQNSRAVPAAILFIVFGLGELSKIALVVIGVFPTIALDAYLRARAVRASGSSRQRPSAPRSSRSRAGRSFPASPYMLDGIRLNLKAVMLLSSPGNRWRRRSVSANRVFVVRRYLAMDSSSLRPLDDGAPLRRRLAPPDCGRTAAAIPVGAEPELDAGLGYIIRLDDVTVSFPCGDGSRKLVPQQHRPARAARRVPDPRWARPAAGKSTLLRLILGCDRPTAGAVRVDGDRSAASVVIAASSSSSTASSPACAC